MSVFSHLANFTSRGVNLSRTYSAISTFNFISSSSVGFKTLPSFRYVINASKCFEIAACISPMVAVGGISSIGGNGGSNACDLNVSFNWSK